MKWTLMMVLAVGVLVAGVGGWAWAGEREGDNRGDVERARSQEGDGRGPGAPGSEALEATVRRLMERLERLERIVAELAGENARLRRELSAKGESADRERREREEGQKKESGDRGEGQKKESGERGEVGREGADRPRGEMGDRPRGKEEGGEAKPRREGEGAAAGVAGAVPEGLRGFRGRVSGRVVRVGDRGFVVKVDKVLNVWEGNKAREPQSAVGKNLAAVVGPDARESGRHLEVLRNLAVGDRVVVELFHDGGDVLRIVEEFRIED